jgi:AraC-like DNA-binding protein
MRSSAFREDRHVTLGAGFDRLHSDLSRHFAELVVHLGGEPRGLLRLAGLDAAALRPPHQDLGYRSWARLLQTAAAELDCPDIGRRLARLQRGGRVFGPIGAVMTNARTFGEGLRYFAQHTEAHSPAVRLRLEWDAATRTTFSAHDILVDGVAQRAQLIEQILLLGHLNAGESTGGRARVREVRMRHQPLAALASYRRDFGCEVLFDQQADGVVYSERDMAAPVVDADASAFARATAFIEAEFPRATLPMQAQVRGVILQLLGVEPCSSETVAARLNLHSRTLHRRLQGEGTGFQQIKDEVRRDLALYYLRETAFDLAHVAQKLGYAEHSVFTRSCVRWFAAAPSELRARAAA